MSLEPPESVVMPTRGRFQFAIWLAAAATIAYLCRFCMVVTEKTIRSDLGISETEMGWIMGPVFFWSYALAQIPGSWLGHRFGSRRMLSFFAVLWSLGTAAWGLANGFLLLLIGRLSVGIAQAGLFPCAASSIARWSPVTERAWMSGLLAAAMQVGSALAAVLTGWLLGYWNWQIIFAIYSIPGLLWAVGFYFWFRDDPADHPAVNRAELDLIHQGRPPDHHHRVAGTIDSGEPSPPAASVPWERILTSRTMWIICAQQFFRAAGAVWFGSWFATYLQETRHVSQQQSGWLLAIPLLSAFAASLMGGSLSDFVLRRTGSRSLARRGLATASLVLCSLLVFSAYFIEDATLATATIGAGVFCASFAGPCAYAVTIDMGGRHVAPVFGVMNMIGNFGAGLLPWLVPHFRVFVDQRPALLDLSGGNSWNAVLVLFAAMYLLAACFWMLLQLEGTIGDDPAETR